jgi:uncharacterized LabA/DUF88 family protein
MPRIAEPADNLAEGLAVSRESTPPLIAEATQVPIASRTPEGAGALSQAGLDQAAWKSADEALSDAPALEESPATPTEDLLPNFAAPWEAAGTGAIPGTPQGFGALLDTSITPPSLESPAEGDILARALREMFPLGDDEAEPAAFTAETDNAEADAALTPDMEGADAADAAPSDELSEAELNRRRGRRGRRGGRGRRRNGASAADDAAETLPDNGVFNAPAPSTVTAAPLGDPPASLFVPESPPREERSWRDRGPRRQWGRVFSREDRTTQMPPPKPSNGFRPGPIPRAVPPLAAVAESPAFEVPATTAFQMPDLRIDEPLAPGETRTERLLEAQTRLLQAMLEQQSRQIDILTSSVTSLRQTVQHLNSTRTQLPRTAIFVDAPNVCYAAENARVNIDFGRMLKYLSKDRQLVHALSYAPITDDVREGIRYETQRFVAPFLRSGYKMVTKPLKRFPDGSAKGNFDIELAIDIVTMSERLDIVVLVSGDSDFERMIELIQSKGVRVEVVAFASNVSTELVNVADVFIDINQHIEHMRAL